MCMYKPVSTHGIDISVFVRIQKSYSLQLKVDGGDMWMLSSTPYLDLLCTSMSESQVFFGNFFLSRKWMLIFAMAIARLREDALSSLFTSVRSGCSFYYPSVIFREVLFKLMYPAIASRVREVVTTSLLKSGYLSGSSTIYARHQI